MLSNTLPRSPGRRSGYRARSTEDTGTARPERPRAPSPPAPKVASRAQPGPAPRVEEEEEEGVDHGDAAGPGWGCTQVRWPAGHRAREEVTPVTSSCPWAAWQPRDARHPGAPGAPGLLSRACPGLQEPRTPHVPGLQEPWDPACPRRSLLLRPTQGASLLAPSYFKEQLAAPSCFKGQLAAPSSFQGAGLPAPSSLKEPA